MTNIPGWEMGGPHLNFEAKLGALTLDDAGKVVDAELLGELVEDPELAPLRRVVDGQLHTAYLQCTTPWVLQIQPKYQHPPLSRFVHGQLQCTTV